MAMNHQSATIAVLCSMASCGAASADSPAAAHGQRLVAEYRVPAQTIADYARFKPSAPDAKESKLVNTLFAETVPWRGPAVLASPGHNPYTVVLRVSGVAVSNGDVSSLWRAGWEFAVSDGGTQEQVSAVGGIARLAATAGESMVLEAAAGPVSFKAEREVTPYVGLVQVRNFVIRDVQVQVWQGVAPPRWREIVLSTPALGVGLVMLALVVWWRRR